MGKLKTCVALMTVYCVGWFSHNTLKMSLWSFPFGEDWFVRDGVPFCRGSCEGEDSKQQENLSQQETLLGVLESQRAT